MPGSAERSIIREHTILVKGDTTDAQGNRILNYLAPLRRKPESSDRQLGKLGAATVLAGAGFPLSRE